jgi:hypothetical protein
MMEGVEVAQSVPLFEYGLSTRNAADVKIITEAVRRENKHLTDLGGFESVYNMMNIVKSMGLPVTQRGELREWLVTNRL